MIARAIMGEGKRAAEAVGGIVAIGLAMKVLGFAREMIMANYYGATGAMDAYNVAGSVPTVLLTGLGSAITTTFIPAFSRKLKSDGATEAFGLTRKLATAVLFLSLTICALGFAFAFPLSRLMAPSFPLDKAALTAGISRVLLTTGPFTVLSALCTGVLQAQGRFAVPALLAIPLNVTVVGVVGLFAGTHGIYALAWGTALSAVAVVAFQVPSVLRTGLRLKPCVDFADPDVQRVGRLALPTLAGSIMLQCMAIVDRVFASALPEGSIAALAYASRITGLVTSVVVSSIATVSLPTLSRAAAESDLCRVRETLLRALQAVDVLVLPIVAGTVVLRVPLIRLLFQRGAFDSRATAIASTALLYLGAGLCAYGWQEVLARTFYALRDTLVPMINTTVLIGFNIALLSVMVPRYGLAGLAGTSSLCRVLGAVVLLLTLRRKLGRICGVKLMTSLLKTGVAALVMAVCCARAYQFTGSRVGCVSFAAQLTAVGLTAVLGMLVYVFALWLLRAEEVQIAVRLIRGGCRRSVGRDKVGGARRV